MTFYFRSPFLLLSLSTLSFPCGSKKLYSFLIYPFFSLPCLFSSFPSLGASSYKISLLLSLSLSPLYRSLCFSPLRMLSASVILIYSPFPASPCSISLTFLILLYRVFFFWASFSLSSHNNFPSFS